MLANKIICKKIKKGKNNKIIQWHSKTIKKNKNYDLKLLINFQVTFTNDFKELQEKNV